MSQHKITTVKVYDNVKIFFTQYIYLFYNIFQYRFI